MSGTSGDGVDASLISSDGDTNYNVEIKVIADMYNILTGSVKMNSIFGALLITVSPEIMPSWQKILKK